MLIHILYVVDFKKFHRPFIVWTLCYQFDYWLNFQNDRCILSEFDDYNVLTRLNTYVVRMLLVLLLIFFFFKSNPLRNKKTQDEKGREGVTPTFT